MIIDFIRCNPKNKFIIVALTHNLKNQIYSDARNSGITNIFNTPDIKDRTLLDIESVSISKLAQIKRSLNLPAPVVSKIDTLCNYKTSGEKKYIRCEHIGSLEGVFGEITDFYKVDVNLYGLLQAECFAIDDENVYFLDEKFLLEIKMIIMSVTVDAELYRYRKIYLYECRKAKYMGKVIQYMDYSYSRFFFNENEIIIDELRKSGSYNTQLYQE